MSLNRSLTRLLVVSLAVILVAALAGRVRLVIQHDGLFSPGSDVPISNDLLPCPCSKRQQMQLAIFAAQQSTEKKTPSGAGDKNVTVQRFAEMFRCQLFEPQLIPAPVVADAVSNAKAQHIAEKARGKSNWIAIATDAIGGWTNG